MNDEEMIRDMIAKLTAMESIMVGLVATIAKNDDNPPAFLADIMANAKNPIRAMEAAARTHPPRQFARQVIDKIDDFDRRIRSLLDRARH